MMDTKPDSLVLRWISRLVFLLPGRAAAKMAEFSHTEYGSGLDMLAATALTGSRARRRLYFQHALDELEHARLFRERASALAGPHGRALAILADHARVVEHGIHTKEPLFSTMEEPEFLAFVWIHERNGERQFRTYADILKADAETSAMFGRIFVDERFHVTYSRTELDRLGQPERVRKAVWAIRLRRLRDAWLRLGHVMGEGMAWLWLSLAYLLLVGPFSLVASVSERRGGGLVAVEEAPGLAARTAQSQG
ncbi:MAG: hypothetical protein H6732_15365 [Alphaproteobacteria bacterium]|nr:hypothetical protein [Alphaproteobacteria bacterium]